MQSVDIPELPDANAAVALLEGTDNCSGHGDTSASALFSLGK